MKTILVIGASHGPGAALVRAAADLGYAVIGVAGDAGAIDTALTVRALSLDSASDASLRALAETLFAEGARVDLLIDAAGMDSGDRGNEDLDPTFRFARLPSTAVAGSPPVREPPPMRFARMLSPILATDAVVLDVSFRLGSTDGVPGLAGSKALPDGQTRGAALEREGDARDVAAPGTGRMRPDPDGTNAERTLDEIAAEVLGRYASGTPHTANGRVIDADGPDRVG